MSVPAPRPIWRPFKMSVLLCAVMNAIPLALAQISETWMRVGWVYYFYTIPLGLLLIIVGLIWSLRRKADAS